MRKWEKAYELLRRALSRARNHQFGPAWESMDEAWQILDNGKNEKRFVRDMYDRAVPIIEGLERAHDRRRG